MRERIVYGLAIIAVLFFALGPGARAGTTDVGSLVSVPSRQCTSSSGWLGAEKVQGQPDVLVGGARSEIDQDNAAQQTAEAGEIICLGYEETADVRVASALTISLTGYQTEEPQDPMLPESIEPQLNDAPTQPQKIDARETPELPNAFDNLSTASLDSLLSIDVSDDEGKTWQQLQIIDTSLFSLTEPHINILLPEQFNKDLSKLGVRIQSLRSGDTTSVVLIDSVTVTYAVGQAKEIELRIRDDSGRVTDSPLPVLSPDKQTDFELITKDPNDGLLQGLSNKITQLASEGVPFVDVESTVKAEDGTEVLTAPAKSTWKQSGLSNENTWDISVDMPRQAEPGRYSVTLQVASDDGTTQSITQDFLWGVLAMNFSKSTYAPGETAIIEMAVLDERGYSVCDADVSLEFVLSGSTIARRSTTAGDISISGQCDEYISDIPPDYSAAFTPESPGTYDVVLTAVTANGEYEISDQIVVAESSGLVIERLAPTRIYPIYSSTMKLRVISQTDQSVVITDFAPGSFQISPTSSAASPTSISNGPDGKTITWNLTLKAGVPAEIGYEFDAPDVSPEFFLIGPVQITDNAASTIFTEPRSWQLAGDAVGNYAIYRETGSGDAITTTQAKVTWDTSESEGSGFSINVGRDDVTLSDAGHYLVMYTIGAQTTGGTNTRSEINTNIDLNGSDLTAGRSSCYLRRSGGADECWVSGSAIIDATAADTLSIEAQLTDTGSGTVGIIANESAIQVIKLQDTWDYARVRENGGGQSFNATTFATVSLDTNDELDSGTFSRTDGAITLANAGHYLVTANLEFANGSGARRNNEIRLTLDGEADGNEIIGTRTTAYTRSSESTNNHTADYIGIIETSTSNQVVRLQAACEGEACGSVTSAADRTAITIAKLPDSADYIRINEDSTGGGQAVDGSLDPILWDTNSEVDTGSFSHSTASNTSQVNIDLDDDYLLFGSFYSDRTSTTNGNRLYPHWEWRTSGSSVENYGSFGKFNRGDQSTTGTYTGGDSAGIIMPGLLDTDYVELVNTDESTGTDSLATFIGARYAMQGVSLSTILPPPPAETNQAHYRWRDDTTDLNTTGGWLAAEDTGVTVDKLEQARLRIEVANEGDGAEAAARTYELQFGDKAGVSTCSSITTWTGVADSATDEVGMFSSTHIDPDGELTTSGLLANTETYTFIDGEGRKNTDTTGSIGPLSASYYTELEYALEFTDEAVVGHTYCFRVYDTTGSETLDNYNAFAEATVSDVSVSLSVLGESGTFTSPDDGGWQAVTFQNTYTTPVVVGITNTRDGNPALVFEADNVTTTGADMRVCESEGSTANGCGTHSGETVGYLVIDSAVAATTAGIEAGTFTTSGADDTTNVTTNYSGSFTTAPLVFANVNTVNSTEFPIQVVINSATTTNFNAGICDHLLSNNDACDTSHGNETVGWIAIEPGNEPFLQEFDTGSQSIDTDNDSWASISFSPTFTNVPVLLYASQTDTGGQDVEHEEARNVTTGGADIHFCEIDANNTCDSHSADTAAWLAIENGVIEDAIVLDQDGYRWYDGVNNVTPTTPLGNENEAILNVADNDVLRLRMAVQNGKYDLPASFFGLTLQYSSTATTCSAASGWTDVGGIGSGVIWRGDNQGGTTTDGSTLPSSLLDGAGNTLMTYEESNDSAQNPNAINEGDRGEWDWVIENNGAADLTKYCFRVTDDGGNAIGYTRYAELTTESGEAPLDPNSPTSLGQEKTTATSLSVGDFTNETSVVFTANISDQNTADVIKLCVEVQPLGTAFTGTETGCGATVAYSGTAVAADVTINSLDPQTSYHWQARVEDANSAVSSWVSFGANAETAADYSIDNIAPTVTVFDGTTTGVDIDLNNGDLDELSANWANDPYDLPSGLTDLVLHLDAADTSTITTAGSAVSAWNDRSGNGNNFSQGTPGSQPTNTSDGGYSSIVQFDGVADFMQDSNGVFGNGNTISDWAIFQVSKDLTTTANDGIFRHEYAGTAWHGIAAPYGGTSLHYVRFDDSWDNKGSYGGDTTNYYVNRWESYNSASNIRAYYRNRAQVWQDTTTVSFTSDNGAMTIGDYSGTGANSHNYNLAEMLIFDARLTSSETTEIENYLACKWSLSHCVESAISTYEYSVGTVPGSSDVKTWTSNGTSQSITDSALSLNTSQPYFFNVRVTDAAGNQSVASSDGIIIAPTLNFSTSPAGVTFGALNAGNSYTSTDTTTLTTSTNAYNGYEVRAFVTGPLTSVAGDTIGFFDGGTYASPDEWLGGDIGYGYTSNDSSIQGSNIFGGSPCAGGGNPPCYAPFSTTAPGDVIADHTSLVSGTPITNENFVITHRVTTENMQEAGDYQTTIVYTITAKY